MKNFRKKCALYLKKIKDRYENSMKNKNKKLQKKMKELNLNPSLNNEENLRNSPYYDEYDFRDVETIEYSRDSDEAFESLKMYIKDLYKKQEDAKKLQ